MTGLVRERPISEVTVLPAHPREHAAVKALIIQGLTQRWSQYNASFNPDLEHFADSYQQAVVLVAKIDDLIIGCGVLMKEADSVGRIVRMTVRADRQRTSVEEKFGLHFWQQPKPLATVKSCLKRPRLGHQQSTFTPPADLYPANWKVEISTFGW